MIRMPKSSAVNYYVVKCSVCGALASDAKESREEAEAAATENGFVRQYGENYCERCFKKAMMAIADRHRKRA